MGLCTACHILLNEFRTKQMIVIEIIRFLTIIMRTNCQISHTVRSMPPISCFVVLPAGNALRATLRMSNAQIAEMEV